MRATIGTIQTPFGPGLIAWTARGVIALEAFVTGGDDGSRARVRFRELVASIAGDQPDDGVVPGGLGKRLAPAIQGDTRRSPVDLRVFDPLRRDVYGAATRIPRGTVASYAEIAADIGRPRAWRAVGTALRRCPIDLLVPAHRVVHAGGRIAGPTAVSIEWKRTLLRREGVVL